MQASVNINTILQNVSSLSLEDQSYITEILNNRINEKRRLEIFQRAKEAEENYQVSNVSNGNANDLLKLIEDD